MFRQLQTARTRYFVLRYRLAIAALIVATASIQAYHTGSWTLVAKAASAYCLYFIGRHAVQFWLGDRYYSASVQFLRTQLTLLGVMVFVWISGTNATNVFQSPSWLFLALPLSLSAEHETTKVHIVVILEAMLYLVTFVIVRPGPPIVDSLLLPSLWLVLLTLPLHYAVRTIDRLRLEEKQEYDSIREILNESDSANPLGVINDSVQRAAELTQSGDASLWIWETCIDGFRLMATTRPNSAGQIMPSSAAPSDENNLQWETARAGALTPVRAIPLLRGQDRLEAVLEFEGVKEAMPRRQYTSIGRALKSRIAHALSLTRYEAIASLAFDLPDIVSVAPRLSEIFGYTCEFWSVSTNEDTYIIELESSSTSDPRRLIKTADLSIIGVSVGQTEPACSSRSSGTSERKMLSVPIAARSGQPNFVVVFVTPDRFSFTSDDLRMARMLRETLCRRLAERAAAAAQLLDDLQGDIHSSIKQPLFWMTNIIERLADALNAGQDDLAKARVRELLSEIDFAKAQVDDLLEGRVLHMTTPAHLIAEIDEYARSISERKKINVDMEGLRDVPPLAPARLRLVYRFLREGLTNAAKHGRNASRIEVSFQPLDTTFIFRISDNGKENSYVSTGAKGRGIREFERMARQLRGSYDMRFCGGTTVELTFPRQTR